MNFTSPKTGKIDHEEFMFKIAAFTGNMSVEFYLDEKYSARYTAFPYEYMSDAQYIFTKEDIQKNLTKGIYIKITSMNRTSTYTISFLGRSKEQSI